MSQQNVNIKRELTSYNLIDYDYKHNPICIYKDNLIKDKLMSFFNYENMEMTILLVSEAIINQTIYEIYEIDQEDREKIELKIGKSIGELPICVNAKAEFCQYLKEYSLDSKENILNFVEYLPLVTFDDQEILRIKEEIPSLYQTNNNLEEFCVRNQINPINLSYWFKESYIMPPNRAHEIVLEFLIDAFKIILQKDIDGIIPLFTLPNEPCLLDRLEQYCYNIGFTTAQFMQLDNILGCSINEYIENHFFENICNHFNLFMYLPKTPFIWHLSSGPMKGIGTYIIIYKWNRDSLFKLKTSYITQREENLKYRLIQLADIQTAQAQNEKDLIRLQLEEIASFSQKIDNLIAEGYNPKLDDGVGKNIAPLQQKGLLRAEVLNKGQLEKYLNADW